MYAALTRVCHVPSTCMYLGGEVLKLRVLDFDFLLIINHHNLFSVLLCVQYLVLAALA